MLAYPSIQEYSGAGPAGTGASLRALGHVIDHVAQANVNMLLLGEAGTSKQMLAERIHERGPCFSDPFLAVALEERSEHEIEHALFGVDGGAFAPAACGATLYLDAVEALSPRLQGELARVLTRREGDCRVRVIAGTSAPLEQLARMGQFRRDLYFRLAVVRIALPPLRERREDIAAIAEEVIGRWSAAAGVKPPRITPLGLTALMRHAWPGNARELVEVLEAVLPSSTGSDINAEQIRTVLARRSHRGSPPDVVPLRQLQRDYLAAVLGTCKWNQSFAARRLGIGRNTLTRKIKALGLRPQVGEMGRAPERAAERKRAGG